MDSIEDRSQHTAMFHSKIDCIYCLKLYSGIGELVVHHDIPRLECDFCEYKHGTCYMELHMETEYRVPYLNL